VLPGRLIVNTERFAAAGRRFLATSQRRADRPIAGFDAVDVSIV